MSVTYQNQGTLFTDSDDSIYLGLIIGLTHCEATEKHNETHFWLSLSHSLLSLSFFVSMEYGEQFLFWKAQEGHF